MLGPHPYVKKNWLTFYLLLKHQKAMTILFAYVYYVFLFKWVQTLWFLTIKIIFDLVRNIIEIQKENKKSAS